MAEGRQSEDSITVTISRADAWCLVLGPLDYTVQSMMRRAVPKGGSTLTIRQRLACELHAEHRLNERGMSVLYIDGQPAEEGTEDV